MDNIEVSQVSRQCWKVHRSRLLQPRLVAAGRNRHHQASVRTKCWRRRPSGLKRQTCANSVTRSSGMKGERRNSGCRASPLVRKAGLKNLGKWRRMKKSIARRSWISERKSWFYNSLRRITEFPDNRKMWETYSKRNGSKRCKISSKGGTILCQSIKRCRRDHKSCSQQDRNKQCRKNLGKLAEDN